jgi:cell division protease FtsH
MKTITFWILILITSVLLYSVVQRTSGGRTPTVAFSRFLQEVEHNNVNDVTIADPDIKGHLKSGEAFKTVMPMDYPQLIDMLRDKNIGIIVERSGINPWFPALLSWVPLFLQIGFWILFMRPNANRPGPKRAEAL